MYGHGTIAIAERKHAQGDAPPSLYLFTHESDAPVPGTQH